MILAVRLDMHGPLAGMPVVCRQITGMQRWLIKFDLVTPEGVREEREIAPAEAIPLHLLAPVAMKSIEELLRADGITAKRASWKAYVLPRKSTRNRK